MSTTPSVGIRSFTRDQLIRMAQLFAGDPDLTRLIDTTATERTRHELASTPHLEVWVMTWPPGVSTGWHDHGDVAGAYVVLSGAFRESAWSGGAVHSRELSAGDERSFAAGHLHDLANVGDGFGLTIHAYSPALTQMTPYEWVDGKPVPIAL
ncbi:cysteine dioxygenase [Leekyejoonella antrihumi]|uniref:Cysteine dioxygenase n=1 Tax=Leekyejoonella antrihumi TaxID=1660198 RepID=A0A563E0P4_9MICO|nr:cysteine dioxygenase family protein [Leekyejoonella antrihumi]TWP36086.1 cysteine dioxygenase [Leekyejoonella antrihumi]